MVWLALPWAVGAALFHRSDPLAKGFAHPPAAARPWVYWVWMDGNLSREGITADLEAMQRAGIGGVIIMEVNVGIPQGPVRFMSPEWRQLFKHVVRETERLGLQVSLISGPGWTGSGGPWVKPEQSMQHLVASALKVAGPKHFDQILPRPQRRPAFFGDGLLPPDLEKAKNDFYLDAFVLAFPTPAGNERISDIDEKALYVRAPYSSQPGVKPFLPAPAGFPALPAGTVIAPSRILDLSSHLAPDGRLSWDVPPGNWTILRFGRTSTGANTRPAPKPGLGLECDKLDPAALDAHFKAFFGTLLHGLGRSESVHRAAPGRERAGWTGLHIDSWEMGAQNWTDAFRQEFRRRRGYDLLPCLPAITGRVVGSLEVSERFLWDLRQTAQELMIENHALHFKNLGRRYGLSLSIEPYDMMPCSDMEFGAVADVPMCEFWLYGFDTSYSVFEAASIAHTCGRRIVAAESFTSTEQERWQAYPGSMKALGDWAFCAGVNRIVFHRYQHQPWLDLKPGMTMGPYGVHWERTQTWWNMVPAYHSYLARCQYLLRQGLPVADVCFLVPEGAPEVFRPPSSATRGSPPDHLGYNFDGCAPGTLLKRMSVKDGRLVLPDGMSYRVLVLPERQTITPQLLRKLKELAMAGATVIGPRPLKSPSLVGYPGCDAQVRQLADELWGRQGDADGMAHERDGNDGKHAFGTPLIHPSTNPSIAGSGDEPDNPLEHARWIWSNEGQPDQEAPVGKRYFRRLLRLGTNQGLTSARMTMTADNSFELRVNGHRAVEGDNFNESYTADITPLLRPGTNLLAVVAENGGDKPNPAGLIGSLHLQFNNGETIELTTDHQWQTAVSAASDWTTDIPATQGWRPALELGPFDMAPWKLSAKPAKQPQQYGDFGAVVALLKQMGVPPDFECEPLTSTLDAWPASLLRYTHRRVGSTDLYFVANPAEQPVAAKCLFRVSGKRPELWDPVTGRRRELGVFSMEDGRTQVPLRFEAHQSFFIVFRKAAGRPKPAGPNFPQVREVAELAGPWEVSFDPKWGGPERVTFSTLQDWTQRPEPGIRFYSGTATYRKTFDLPASSRITHHASRLLLDLGSVKNLARVRLNGHVLGVVWCEPWEVDLTGAVKPKGNCLEIQVVNLWPNRLIGDEQFAADCDYGPGGNLARWPDWLRKSQPRPATGRYTFTTWKHFTKDSPLLPSGLLGPVKVLAEAP